MKSKAVSILGLLIALMILVFSINSCKKDNPSTTTDDYLLKEMHSSTGSYNWISSTFRVVNTKGDTFGPLEQADFSITENDIDISNTIEFANSTSLEIKYKTVILVDVSTENTINIPDIQFAIKEYINHTFDKEKIAIYTFSGELTQLIDFTNNKNELKAAVQAILPGINTRNLNGALMEVLPKFSISGQDLVKYGSVILITKDEDNVNLSSTQNVIDKRGNKLIYTYLLTNQTTSKASGLEQISNGCYTKIEKVTNLAAKLITQHETINNCIRNFYRVGYRSHQIGDKDNELKIAFLNGTQPSNPPSYNFTFNSKDFVVLEANELVVNVDDELLFFPNEQKTIVAYSLYPINPPDYNFQSTNPSKISISDINGGHAVVEAHGSLGYTASIIIKDYANLLIKRIFCEIKINTDVLIDSRDGQTYNITEFAGKWWFTENLRYETTNSVWYDNDPNNEEYGRLYKIVDALTACPEGWTLPSDYDWRQIEGLFDSQYDAEDSEWSNPGWRGFDAGGNMKDNSGQYWNEPNTGATDCFGFKVLPAGERTYNYFSKLHNSAYFWTQSESGSSYIIRGFSTIKKQIISSSRGSAYSLTVRCVKQD